MVYCFQLKSSKWSLCYVTVQDQIRMTTYFVCKGPRKTGPCWTFLRLIFDDTIKEHIVYSDKMLLWQSDLCENLQEG